MKTVSYIYGLFDPSEQIIRYVGQSIRPSFRLAGHLKTGGRNLKEWVAKLADAGRYPCMIILETCDFDSVQAREIYWHRLLDDMDLPLVNHHRGSHRTTVFSTSQQYRDRFSYELHCILEPAFRYRMHYASEPETRAKFGTVLKFAESLATAIYPQESERQSRSCIAIINTTPLP